MHSERLNIALRITCPIDDNEAAHANSVDLGCEFFVRDVFGLFMVAMLDESLECVGAAGVKDTILEPRQEEANAILADTEDALDVAGVFALVAQEHVAADADDLQLVLVTAVRMQVP